MAYFQLHEHVFGVFNASRMEAVVDRATLRLVCTPLEAALTALTMVVEGPAPDPHELARKVESKATEKFDWLSEELLCERYVSAHIDYIGAIRSANASARLRRRSANRPTTEWSSTSELTGQSVTVQ
ncbi:hypothetical protein [Amycolatopsis sp. NPDC051061]|uniref:hypothetical protein n=1 Tax=Amycolatopsis sp. NPDC051061 TaxID=3155042 RepID=UPI003415D142